MPRPAPEVLEGGGTDDRPGLTSRFLALLDRLLEERAPRRHHGLLPRMVAVLLGATLLAGLVTLARHDRAAPPAHLPGAPVSPPVSAAVVAERRQAAYAAARFAQSQSCADRERVRYIVVRHEPDWTRVRYEVRVAWGSSEQGLLVLDVQPSQDAVGYQVVAASGTCHR